MLFMLQLFIIYMESTEQFANKYYTAFPLVVGHTKFLPNYGAGVFKKVFRRTPCTTPQHGAVCARQLAFVPMSDWLQKFSHFKAVPNIKIFHVFKSSSDKPGLVTCQYHLILRGFLAHLIIGTSAPSH